MKTTSANRLIILTSFLSLMMLSTGCGLNLDSSPVVMPDVAVSATQDALSPVLLTASSTLESTPSSTLSATPTASFTASSVATNPSTPSPTPTSTLTPIPTLGQDQATALLQDLLKTNAGCNLPCWWGIQPGQSHIGEAIQYLASFLGLIFEFDPIRVQLDGRLQIRRTYRVLYPDEEGTLDREDMPHSSLIISAQDDIVSSMVVNRARGTGRFALQQVLQTYGPPDRVLLRTFPSSPNYLPFYLIVEYSETGILLFYEVGGVKLNEQIEGCFEDASSMAILSLPNTRTTDLDELNETWFGPDPNSPLLLIQDASGQDVSTFYENVLGGQLCIVTEAELWRR